MSPTLEGETNAPTGSPTATTGSPTAAPTTATPTLSPTATPTTAAPTRGPTAAPTFSATAQVLSNISFAAMNIAELDDPIIDEFFREAFKDAMGKAAGVPATNVEIVSITAGSVNIRSITHFDSLLFGSIVAMDDAVDAMVDKLTQQPQSIFTGSQFAPFGAVRSFRTLRKPAVRKTAAPTLLVPTTAAPTITVTESPTVTADAIVISSAGGSPTSAPTSAAPTLLPSTSAVVMFAVMQTLALYLFAAAY